MVTDRFLKKGLCGLSNLGNTCFMAATVQSINNSLDLTKYFLDKTYINDYNKEKLEHIIVKEWARLCSGLWEKNCVVAPQTFHKAIQYLSHKLGNGEFVGYEQKDAQEFLQFFIEKMHTALCQEVIITIKGTPENEKDKMALEAMKSFKNYFNDNYSIIVKLFYGQYCSTIYCDGVKQSNTYDPYWSLQLEIPKRDNCTLDSCLRHFGRLETLTDFKDDGKVYKREMRLWCAPKNLIIVLKRFNNNNKKIQDIVKFPLDNLDIGEYVVGYEKTSASYSLYAIVNHMGSVDGGHYTSCCLNTDNNWYHFDDNVVSLVKDPNDMIKSSAYILFYKKKE